MSWPVKIFKRGFGSTGGKWPVARRQDETVDGHDMLDQNLTQVTRTG